MNKRQKKKQITRSLLEMCGSKEHYRNLLAYKRTLTEEQMKRRCVLCDGLLVNWTIKEFNNGKYFKIPTMMCFGCGEGYMSSGDIIRAFQEH